MPLSSLTLTPDTQPAPDTEATPAAPRRRRRALAAQGAVVALLVGSATAWVATDKDVTLVVDGEPQAVSTHADVVGDLLAEEGLEVDERDLVAPGVDTPLRDGAEIVVRNARELTLAVDGEPRTVWVTAESVDEALDQIGIADDRAYVSADRSREIPLEGMRVEVRLPKPVAVIDGVNPPVHVETTAADLAGLLGQVGMGLREHDRLSAPLESAPAAGQHVVITRVDLGTRREVVPVAPREVREDDPTLLKGQTKVAAAGQAGELVREIAFGAENGVEVQSSVVSETVTKAAQPRVVKVGTKTPPPAPKPAAAASSGGGSAPGGAWGKVAQCESGGNPRAVSSTGKYHGLYQFSVATWRSVGGSGLPSQASAAEQTKRAQMLLARSGPGQWPHCGKYLRG